MPIINYEDYYKPSKPQPKPKAQYYEPPKWNPKDPRNRDTNVNRPPDIRNLPKPGMPPGFLNFDALNSAMAQTQTQRINQIGSFLSNLWNKVVSQPDAGSPYPMDGTTAMASPTFNTSREPARGAYGMPATPNIVDRNKWQRSLENWWMPPSVREAPPNTSYMPNYPQPYVGLYTPWATVVMDKITNPTGSRMGGTSGITRMTDTGGAGAGAGNNPGQRSSPTFVPTTRMSDDRAWQNSRARTGDAIRPQDYFIRTVLNGIGYSIPNQMLNFTDTGGVSADWEQTPRWYEPPAGYTTSGAGWKESIGKPWGLQDVTDGGTFEPVGGYGYGGYGGWGGGGGGGGGAYGASSGVNSYLPGTRAGYGANASSPRYTGGAGGRGSSYAGAQSMNQASWRMPMLVWNI